MRALLVLLALLVAGCAAPEAPPTPGVTPTPGGPIDASGRMGLVAIDTTTRAVELLTAGGTPAWMSPNASHLVWNEADFAVLLTAATGEREVVAHAAWVRVYDNGTGLETGPGRAVWKALRNGTADAVAPLPAAPIPGTRWTGASDDLAVLGVEYVAQGTNCVNDIFLRADANVRTQGCHLRVARDGRAGWTEGGGVRVRETNGTIVNVTAPGGGDIAQDAYVAHENPVFTSDGMRYLRITGGESVVRNEIVDEDGDVIAIVAGPTRVALVDVSEDGRYLLLRTFTR